MCITAQKKIWKLFWLPNFWFGLLCDLGLSINLGNKKTPSILRFAKNSINFGLNGPSLCLGNVCVLQYQT